MHIIQFFPLGSDILCRCCRCRSHCFKCPLLLCLRYFSLLLLLGRRLLLGLLLPSSSLQQALILVLSSHLPPLVTNFCSTALTISDGMRPLINRSAPELSRASLKWIAQVFSNNRTAAEQFLGNPAAIASISSSENHSISPTIFAKALMHPLLFL